MEMAFWTLSDTKLAISAGASFLAAAQRPNNVPAVAYDGSGVRAAI